MKSQLLVIWFFTTAVGAFGQESRFSLSGGWTNTNIEDADENASGWRITGTYEYMPWKSKFAHGFSFGYTVFSFDKQGSLNTTEYEVSSIPIYYAPKFLFGKKKFNGFIKGALGAQISSFRRKGGIGTIEDNDFGFLAGGGIGAHYFINEKIFLTGEYELLWLSNSYYRDGLLNSVNIGLGIRFK